MMRPWPKASLLLSTRGAVCSSTGPRRVTSGSLYDVFFSIWSPPVDHLMPLDDAAVAESVFAAVDEGCGVFLDGAQAGYLGLAVRRLLLHLVTSSGSLDAVR